MISKSPYYNYEHHTFLWNEQIIPGTMNMTMYTVHFRWQHCCMHCWSQWCGCGRLNYAVAHVICRTMGAKSVNPIDNTAAAITILLRLYFHGVCKIWTVRWRDSISWVYSCVDLLNGLRSQKLLSASRTTYRSQITKPDTRRPSTWTGEQSAWWLQIDITKVVLY